MGFFNPTSANTIVPGTTPISGGTNTRVLFDDNGFVGESAGLTYTKASGLLAATAVAIGGATIGSNALAVTGSGAFSGNLIASAYIIGGAGNLTRINPAPANADGKIAITNNAITAGATLDFTTDSTLKLFARDGTTPGAFVTGTAQTSAPSGASAGVWKLGSLVTAAVVLDTTRSIFVDIGGVVYKLMVAQ